MSELVVQITTTTELVESVRPDVLEAILGAAAREEAERLMGGEEA